MLLCVTLAAIGLRFRVPTVLARRAVAGALLGLALLALILLLAVHAVPLLALLALLRLRFLRVLRVLLGHGWFLEQVLNNCTR